MRGEESRVGAWDRFWARTVTIHTSPSGDGTRVSVKVGPVGNEDESRAVLVGLLDRLSL